MPTVSFHTLGCKLNYAETGTIERSFGEEGFDVVQFGKPADVTVINTCSVTQEAERKCRQVIRRTLRNSPDTFIVVTGCYAQLRPAEIAAIPGVQAVLGTREKSDLFRYLKSFDRQEETQVAVSCIDQGIEFGPAYAASERTRAFLKVQDGCDYSCAFCTIPAARGPSRSARKIDVISQARLIAEAGYREIVLSGVNIGLFGADTGESLLELLRLLDEVDGIDRFRISSIEPNLLTDAIVEFVAGSKRFMPHFHIPLQSGDDEVLGKMRRRYKRAKYANRIETIRSLLPDASIGADVITGFPTETAEHFQNTVHFLKTLDISYLHVFTYSERPGTVAAMESTHRVPGNAVAERSRRTRILRLVSEQKRAAFQRLFLGSERPVLWEASNRSGEMFGFTDNYIRVRTPWSESEAGSIRTVLLSGIGDHGDVVAASPEFTSLI